MSQSSGKHSEPEIPSYLTFVRQTTLPQPRLAASSDSPGCVARGSALGSACALAREVVARRAGVPTAASALGTELTRRGGTLPASAAAPFAASPSDGARGSAASAGASGLSSPSAASVPGGGAGATEARAVLDTALNGTPFGGSGIRMALCSKAGGITSGLVCSPRLTASRARAMLRS